MTPLDWAIAASAIALIAFVNWFFLGSKGTAVVAAAAAPGSVVDVIVLVEGGYTPSTVEVPAGSRVRLTFDRREDNPCSDEIVIPDFGIRKPLAAHARIHRDTGPPRILVRHGDAARRDHREVRQSCQALQAPQAPQAPRSCCRLKA